MVQHSKSIDGIAAEPLAADAARQALSARLEIVRHDLPLAAEAAGDEVEYVDQLRTSSRRATTALRVFRNYLPSRHNRWMKQQLEAIGQAAGDARDDDVLASRLAPAAEQDTTGTLGNMLRQVQAHRLQAMAPIVKVHSRTSRNRFDRRVVELVDSIAWCGRGAEPTFACMAKRAMREVMATFLKAAGEDLSAPGALHQLRIEGEQIRNTMEIFVSAFAPEFRGHLYCQVEELQERLREVDDHAAAQVCYQRWLASAEPGAEAAQLTKMILEEQAQLEGSLRLFAAWWTPDEAESLCHGLAAVLD